MADYTFDVQKLYLEMMMADAESFARAQNIFDPNSFDRKLQPIAKFIKDYVEEYKVMPEVEQVNAQHDIKLKTAKDLIRHTSLGCWTSLKRSPDTRPWREQYCNQPICWSVETMLPWKT
jgi:hypothetical protein